MHHIFVHPKLEVSINTNNLNWQATSRNTKVAVKEIDGYGDVFFKKGILLNKKNIPQQIESYKALNKITDNILNTTSPKVIEILSSDSIIALESISGASIHELWKKGNYHNDDISNDIGEAYETLLTFHNVTKRMFGNFYYFKDFGPKNIMKISKDLKAIIDPPNKFIFKNPYHDFGILFFEINRSLLQTGRFKLLWAHIKTVMHLINEDEKYSIYEGYKKGIRTHFLRVTLRYLLFFKKINPARELIRGLFLVPFLFFYFLFTELMIFIYQIKK